MFWEERKGPGFLRKKGNSRTPFKMFDKILGKYIFLYEKNEKKKAYYIEN
jgi:hypothetical protein